MTADRANVTQWLAWALMILTGAMNRPGGDVVPSRIRLPASEPFGDLRPITPIEGSLRPRPPSRPEAHAFIGEWPCAALPDEIAAGNVRAVINVGGSLVTSFPQTGNAHPGPPVPRGPRDHRDHQQRDHRVVHPRPADQGPAGTPRHHHLRVPHFAGGGSTAPPSSNRSASGDRRGGSLPNSADDSVTISAVSATPTPAPTTTS